MLQLDKFGVLLNREMLMSASKIVGFWYGVSGENENSAVVMKLFDDGKFSAEGYYYSGNNNSIEFSIEGKYEIKDDNAIELSARVDTNDEELDHLIEFSGNFDITYNDDDIKLHINDSDGIINFGSVKGFCDFVAVVEVKPI